MPKKKIYYRHEIPSSVVNIVKSVCADYDRRARVIGIDGSVLDTYLQLNGIIDKALEEVEPGIRRIILDDVRLGRGYDFSPASPFLAKNTYYSKKRKLVYDIAKGLRLI